MRYSYEVLSGFFKQSELTPRTWLIGSGEHFGSVDTSPNRWKNLVDRMNQLAKSCSSNERIKLLWIARHCQGYHNAAQDKYRLDWEGNYALKTGDSEYTWGPDPFLTPFGEQQAEDNHVALVSECREGLPLPEIWYCSPMRRTASTLMLTFGSMRPSLSRPIFIEELRERLGVSTCDKRSTKTILETENPAFDFHQPFDEDDTLWVHDYRESESEMVARLRIAFEKIFDSDLNSSRYISITTHAGAIRAICTVLGHPVVAPPTGGILPVVVKVTRHAESK